MDTSSKTNDAQMSDDPQMQPTNLLKKADEPSYDNLVIGKPELDYMEKTLSGWLERGDAFVAELIGKVER